jgi:hypothetical protein
MSDLAALLAAPGRQVHVLDLVEAAGGPPRSAAEASTGPVLDSAARAAYTRRLRELQSELEEADRANDRGRSEKLSAEREFLVAELGAAVGLRGRDRMTGDRVEKARKAVAMRVTGALRAIESAHPQLGRHLRSAVSTGRFCCYRPDLPVQWRLRDRS